VSDAHNDAHQRIRRVHGWREWTEGVDPRELDSNGRVKPQRDQGRYVRPVGTRTYYHNTTDLANGAFTAQHENAFGTSAGGSGSESATGIKNGEIIFTATTGSGEPDSSAWPTTGTYRYQLDVTSVGANLEFGLRTLDGAAGGFVRMNSTLTTALQTIAQSQSAFTSSGLHLASVTDPSWSSGSSTDRFAVAVACWLYTGHVKQDLTMQLGETDDYADGPWTAAAAPAYNAPFFGCNF
jgi:hypothetical protein